MEKRLACRVYQNNNIKRVADLVLFPSFLSTVRGVGELIANAETVAPTTSPPAWTRGLKQEDINYMHRKYKSCLRAPCNNAKICKNSSISLCVLLRLQNLPLWLRLDWFVRFANCTMRPTVWAFRSPRRWRAVDVWMYFSRTIRKGTINNNDFWWEQSNIYFRLDSDEIILWWTQISSSISDEYLYSEIVSRRYSIYLTDNSWIREIVFY